MTTTVLIWYALAAVLAAYALLAPTLLNVLRFSGRLRVQCPQRHTATWIRVNPFGAALATAYGRPCAHVRACGLLGHNDRCSEGCLRTLH